jgi:NitT/TauT family transport system substrate-binding protein
MKRLPSLALGLALLISTPSSADTAAVRVRVGYFANLTHAQALLAITDESVLKELGPGVKIEPFVFNAGPSAVEALFAGSIDLAYLGPGPAINAFVRSRGHAVRVIAGAASGGARLVVRKASGINSPKDLAGHKIATPQLGNTQDIAARAWLKSQGLVTQEHGGSTELLPIKNSDQLSLFRRGELDAAWAPEPWASRLVHEADGAILVDERSLWPRGQFAMTLLVASPEFLAAHPDIAEKWVRAHASLTRWIKSHPRDAKARLNARLAELTGKPLSNAVLEDAFSAIEFTTDPLEATLKHSAEQAFDLGFLGAEHPTLDGLVDLSYLRKVK